MWQELSNIVEGILEDDSHADTWLLWKGWITLFVHDYSKKVLGFSDDIGQLGMQILDYNTTVRMDNDDAITIWINQALYKPDAYVSLVSTF